MYSVENGTLRLVCARNWMLPAGSRVDATLTLNGIPHFVYQTKNTSDVGDLEFVFTADDIEGQYDIIGKRVSTHETI